MHAWQCISIYLASVHVARYCSEMDLLTLFPRSTRTATDTEIDSRVHGIVKRPETLDHQTLRPEPGGLFDEEIFGPYIGEAFVANEIARSEPIASRFGVITSARISSSLGPAARAS